MESTPIAYIAGLGHSGSTLFDLLLSSHSHVVSVGEIQVLSEPLDEARRQSILEETRCPCGESSVMTCPFWKEVERDLAETHGLSLYSLDMDSPDRDILRKHNESLFTSVANVSGAKCIVDSSKNSDRLDRLMRLTNLNIRPIHLIRNPFGAAYSYWKKHGPTMKFAVVYTQNALYTSIIVNRKPHRVVKYEDLAARPVETISDIMQWLELDLEPSQINWTEHKHHNIGGNRMRYGGQSGIRVDTTWKSNMGLFEKLAIALLTLPTKIPGPLVSRIYERTAGVRKVARSILPKRGFDKRVNKGQ